MSKCFPRRQLSDALGVRMGCVLGTSRPDQLLLLYSIVFEREFNVIYFHRCHGRGSNEAYNEGNTQNKSLIQESKK